MWRVQGCVGRNLLSAFRCLNGRVVRRSTVAASGQREEEDSASEAKPFSAIPGPSNSLTSALSLFRARHRLHEFFRDRHAQYGPIYKEWMGPTQMVFIADPDGVAQVLRQDGKYPSRPDIPVMRAHREQGNVALSIVLTEGEDWYRVRRVVNQPLMRIKNVAQFLGAFHSVAEELVDILARKRDPQGVVPDLEEDIFKWALETSCSMLYEKRLGAFESQPGPEIEPFIRAALDGAAALNVLFFLPANAARLIFPRKWNKFASCQDVIYAYSRKCVEEKMRELAARGEEEQEREVGIIEYLLSSPDVTLEEVFGNINDIMPAAIDTTSQSSLYALHQLAAHPQVQQKLYDDITAVMAPGQPPTYDSLQQLPLLKAVIKETMRMYPVVNNLARILNKDAVLLGYQVPKDTTVTMSTYTMGRQESIFPDAESFRPERWVRGQEEREIHPFAFLPFGFGTRMCVGRRLAELEMQVLITEMLRRFRLEPVDSEPLQLKTAFLNVPAKPVRLRLVSR